MKKKNRWMHGRKHFAVPALPADLKGRHGCLLQRITFDPSVGEEVCAAYFEEPKFAGLYGTVAPFNLVVHPGLARTPHGSVAFIVWQIAAGSPQEVLSEQYLNPPNIDTLRLVASAANQTHFKLLVINNENSDLGAFVDFENVFQFDQLTSAMANAIGHEPEGNFAAAMEHVMKNMTVPQLLGLSALNMVGET
jgi:hypothetical protein